MKMIISFSVRLHPSGQHAASASQCASSAITVKTRVLKVLPIVPVWQLKSSHQLRRYLAKCMVSCILILCDSVLCCQLYWYVPSLFIYVFQCNPTAQVFRPASPYLSIALKWLERIDQKTVSTEHKALFNSLAWQMESLMCAMIQQTLNHLNKLAQAWGASMGESIGVMVLMTPT